MKRAAALGLLVLLPALRAEARETVSYAPVPAELAAVLADDEDRALLAIALPREPRRLDAQFGRPLLVQLGDLGLKAAAERLAEGVAHVDEKTELLAVVAAAAHPQADTLLARAAQEPRAIHRILAADGLGRGRSPHAVPVLARLARDPIAAVRIAALRSLFAQESPQAIEARIDVPVDAEPGLLARRLTWHRRCEDTAPVLRTLAEDAWRRGPTAELRLAAAAYLVMPAAQTPPPLIERVVTEMGQGPLAAALTRRALGAPEDGYDLVAMRRVAIEGLLTLLSHKDASARKRRTWIEQAVTWVARPVDMDPYSSDPIPEDVLRRRLPDLGPEILEPVVRRLVRHGFDEPRVGVILVRELGADLALPVLRRLVAPSEVPQPFASRADFERARYLRGAAAGALQELGRIGDEALARALLLEDERASAALRIDLVHALAGDDGPWVVPLLIEIAQGRDASLRRHALGILEERPEPEARTYLVEDLFTRGEQPHHRMPALVRRADKDAYGVLTRALADERSLLRKAALSQFHRRRNPQLCGEAGRELLLGHVPDNTSPQEIQDYVYALLNVVPLRAVQYVREHWDAFPKDDIRRTTLRILGEAWGAEARRAAVDLALEQMTPEAERAMLLSGAAALRGPTGVYSWEERVEDVTVQWRRLLFSEDIALQREALRAWAHPKAPEATARLLELLAKALAGRALPERDSTPEGEQTFAREVIQTLPHQPWAEVEDTLLEIALEPLNEFGTRLYAAQSLIGRLSDDARKRLLSWLDYTQRPEGPDGTAPGRIADASIQLFLAAAIGHGGGPVTATLLLETLKQEIFGFYNAALLERVTAEGPSTVVRVGVDARIRALARAIGSTKHEPTILAMLDLVFDARFAAYARACVERQRYVAAHAGPGAAARVPSNLKVLGHDEEVNSNWGMPPTMHDVLYETKALDDEILARGLGATLARARRDGRLAQFPALYMRRVLANLLEPHTGRKSKTAAILLDHARRMGRPDGPMHYFMHQAHVTALADALRFEDAAREQRELVRIIVRGNHDDRQPRMWLRERALQDALEGAAAAVRGEASLAEARFRQAALRAPHDAHVLNGVAWYRALAGFGLEQAEVEALRATRLEARLENRPSPNAADTLAWVLLHRGRAADGLRVLAPRMREKSAHDNGLLHLHMAQMQASVGQLRSARDALVQALTWDRALAAQLAADPWLQPVFAKQSLAQIQALAAARRLEEELP